MQSSQIFAVIFWDEIMHPFDGLAVGDVTLTILIYGLENF
jgi:hypothetical protein